MMYGRLQEDETKDAPLWVHLFFVPVYDIQNIL